MVDLENPPPPKGAELPCVQAIEFLADIYEQAGDKDNILKAVEVTYRSLRHVIAADYRCLVALEVTG
jgi:hypothetical protein